MKRDNTPHSPSILGFADWGKHANARARIEEMERGQESERVRECESESQGRDVNI